MQVSVYGHVGACNWALQTRTNQTVMYCDPHPNILMNGWLTQDIQPSRGIRQGCPISALLFILSIEALANEIRQNNNVI